MFQESTRGNKREVIVIFGMYAAAVPGLNRDGMVPLSRFLITYLDAFVLVFFSPAAFEDSSTISLVRCGAPPGERVSKWLS